LGKALVQTLGVKHYGERGRNTTVYRNVDVEAVLSFLKGIRIPEVTNYSSHPHRLISSIENGRITNVNVAKVEVDRGITEKFVVDNGSFWKVCSLASPSPTLVNDFYADVKTEIVKKSKFSNETTLRVSEGPCMQWFDYEVDKKTNKPDYSLPKIHRRFGAPMLLVLYIFKAVDPETGHPVSDLEQIAFSAALPKPSTPVSSPTSSPTIKIAFGEPSNLTPVPRPRSSSSPATPIRKFSSPTPISPPMNRKPSPEKSYQNLRRQYENSQLYSQSKW
jgi:hypothetical protein